MARNIADIKKQMTDSFLADETLCEVYGNRWATDGSAVWEETFPKVSIENLLIYVVASALYVFERLMDAHMEDVAEVISHRAHTLTWYRDKALEYQHGSELTPEYAEYDNTGLTDTEIQKRKIVKKCSCTNANSTYPTILVKVAKEAQPLDEIELSAFESYMREIADAGIKIDVRSMNPDVVSFKMKIWYDPLVANAQGFLLDGTQSETIAKKAVDEYLSNLRFNGLLYPRLLEQYIMTQRGVEMCKIEEGNAVYADGAGESEIDDYYLPYSGAMVYREASGEFTTEYINFDTTYNV